MNPRDIFFGLVEKWLDEEVFYLASLNEEILKTMILYYWLNFEEECPQKIAALCYLLWERRKK